MKLIRRLFAALVDPDLGRLYKLLLPYKLADCLGLHLPDGGSKHVVPHGYALG